MEGIDHIHVVEVGSRGFIGDVDRVLERQVPDGEGLKLRVTGFHAVLVLVIELRQADCHLAGAGAGSGDDHQFSGRLDIIVPSVAVVADDQIDVGGVVGDRVVVINADAVFGQALFKFQRSRLIGKARQHHGIDIETAAAEYVDQAQYVQIVGDAQIAANLVLFNIIGVDDNDDLRLILELHEHLQLGIGLEARQNARCVIVVKEFAAELQIELAAEFGDTVADMLRLHFKIFFVVKTYFHDSPPLMQMHIHTIYSTICPKNKYPKEK